MAISPSPALPPPAWKDGKLKSRIPQQMIKTSKDSFYFFAIGKFISRRPSLKALEQWSGFAKGIPYHCWSIDILLSIAGSIGKALLLYETTAAQRMLSYARVLVNLDATKLGPNFLIVELEGDATVEVEVLYENVLCSDCFSTGHLSAKCPFSNKPALSTPPSAT
ncbi:hypothetical protein AAC387_Pa08g0941 [Persea americana]